MQDTWANRDLPVLDHIVKTLDDPEVDFVSVAETAQALNLEAGNVVSAFDALEGAGYITRAKAGGKANWEAQTVSSDARRIVGQWPSAESLVDALVQGMEAAANASSDSEQQGRLRKTAEALRTFARDVAVGVAANIVSGRVS
ncbi:hypothetical protein ABZ763_27510 [Streptomyces bacillaris]|uniref:hypothetical protein n=1 Tax=Streptomyces bacillaris TaxID=68179 RepID=UPI00345FC4C7